MRPHPPRSLTVRLALLTGAWVACGLLAAWLLVAGAAASYIESTFNAGLAGLLDAVVAGAELDDAGRPVLARAVSEPRLDEPYSGIYWQIDASNGTLATSRSLWDQTLPQRPIAAPGVRLHSLPGPNRQHLRIAERDIALPGSGTTLHVRVAMAHDAVYHDIERLRHRLAVGFVVLGVGLVVGTVLEVSLLMAPLRRLRRALADLRAGRSRALAVRAGAEVAPLIAEIEALVAQNRATVERARGHIGNLAHALRTDLAVLRNALEADDLPAARAQVAAAETLVSHHLARARSAALTGATAEDVPLAAVAGEVAAALRRLFAARELEITVAAGPGLQVRCERQDLSEMLGNLLENACKWASRRVRLTAMREEETLRILVEDDGPGMPPEAMPRVLARGVRLDETVSGQAPSGNGPAGSGLGLAIVADLAALYGGGLMLEPAEMGGLRAVLTLPAGAGGE